MSETLAVRQCVTGELPGSVYEYGCQLGFVLGNTLIDTRTPRRPRSHLIMINAHHRSHLHTSPLCPTESLDSKLALLLWEHSDRLQPIMTQEEIEGQLAWKIPWHPFV